MGGITPNKDFFFLRRVRRKQSIGWGKNSIGHGQQVVTAMVLSFAKT